MVGLCDEEGAVALGRRDVPMPCCGLGRRERGEDLLLVALDALRSRHDRDQLWKAFEPGQPEFREAPVKAGVSNAVRRDPAADHVGSVDFCLQR